MFSPGCVSPSSVAGFNPVLGSNNSNYTTKVNFNGRTYDAKLLAGTLKGHHYDFKTQESSGLFFNAYVSKNNEKFLKNVEEIDKIVRDILKNPKIQGKLKSEGLTLTKTEDLSLTGVFKGSIGYLDANGQEKRLTVEEISQKVKEEGGNDLGALYSQAYKTMVMSMVDFAGKWISSEEGKTQLTHTPPPSTGLILKEEKIHPIQPIPVLPKRLKNVMEGVVQEDHNIPADLKKFDENLMALIKGNSIEQARKVFKDTLKLIIKNNSRNCHVSYWKLMTHLFARAKEHNCSLDPETTKVQFDEFKKDPSSLFVIDKGGDEEKELTFDKIEDHSKGEWIKNFGEFVDSVAPDKKATLYCSNIPLKYLTGSEYKTLDIDKIEGVHAFNTIIANGEFDKGKQGLKNEAQREAFEETYKETLLKNPRVLADRVKNEPNRTLLLKFATHADKQLTSTNKEAVFHENLSDFIRNWIPKINDFVSRITSETTLDTEIDTEIDSEITSLSSEKEIPEESKGLLKALCKSYVLAELQKKVYEKLANPSGFDTRESLNQYVGLTNYLHPKSHRFTIYQSEMKEIKRLYTEGDPSTIQGLIFRKETRQNRNSLR